MMEHTLGILLLMTTFSLIYRIFPPKKINILYGYRTKRSMKTQEIWDESNRFFSVIWMWLNAITLLVWGVLKYLDTPAYFLRYLLITNIGGIFILILFSELHLRKRFDKEGNRK